MKEEKKRENLVLVVFANDVADLKMGRCHAEGSQQLSDFFHVQLLRPVRVVQLKGLFSNKETKQNKKRYSTKQRFVKFFLFLASFAF